MGWSRLQNDIDAVVSPYKILHDFKSVNVGFFRPFFTGTYLANTSVLVLFLRNVKHAVRFKHGIELILSVFKRFFFQI